MRYFLSHLPALFGIISLSTSALAFQSIDTKRVLCDPNDTDCFANQNKNIETSISDFFSIAELVLKEQDHENLITAIKDMSDEEMDELADNLREMELIEIEDVLEDAAQNNELQFTHGGFEDCKFCLFSSMCASEKCAFLKCSKPNGKLPNDCRCFSGSRCYYGGCQASEDSPGKKCTNKECGVTNNLIDTCPDYLECSTTFSDGICIEPGQEGYKDNGESCLTDAECKSGRCNSDNIVSGYCDDKLDLGEGCVEHEDCKSNNCESSVSCSLTNFAIGCCAEETGPAPAPGENGASCLTDDECQSGRCNSDNIITGYCDDKLDLGEGCVEHEDCKSNNCESSVSCSLTHFAIGCCAEGEEANPPSPVPAPAVPKENGESCWTDEECKSGRCNSDNIISGVCDDKLDLGEGCLQHDDCKSNICESSLSCTWNLNAFCCAEAEGNSPVPEPVTPPAPAPVTPPEPVPAPVPAPGPVLKENGESCTWDEDCKSGRCNSDFIVSGICADKLGDGETCLQNDDCLSNVCESQWRCFPLFCCTGNAPFILES